MVESKLKDNKEIQEALSYIKHIAEFKPDIALVLGSGFGSLIKKIDQVFTLPFNKIPHFPISTVEGHEGNLIFGYFLNDQRRSVPLLIFQGRVHFYETESIEKVIFPIFISNELGARKLIVTNAAGGINSNFNPGDIMLIQDIISNSFVSLLPSWDNPYIPKERHIDFFDSEMKQLVLQCSDLLKIPIQQGSYCWLMGPSYETPAEINMLKRIGADAVGMSTVPEIFAAYSLGMRTVGISLISNLAAGINSEKLSHTEVTNAGKKIMNRFSELLEKLVLSIK